jgi:hypothetical protein
MLIVTTINMISVIPAVTAPRLSSKSDGDHD